MPADSRQRGGVGVPAYLSVCVGCLHTDHRAADRLRLQDRLLVVAPLKRRRLLVAQHVHREDARARARGRTPVRHLHSHLAATHASQSVQCGGQSVHRGQ